MAVCLFTKKSIFLLYYCLTSFLFYFFCCLFSRKSHLEAISFQKFIWYQKKLRAKILDWEVRNFSTMRDCEVEQSARRSQTTERSTKSTRSR